MKYITNHSVRKTLVKRLKQNNVAKSENMSINGLSLVTLYQMQFTIAALNLHVPIKMYKCIVKVYQNPPTISTAPVEKNHEPLKKRHKVMYSSDSSQETFLMQL